MPRTRRGVNMLYFLVSLLTLAAVTATENGDYELRLLPEEASCSVPAQTDAGAVCGAIRYSYNGVRYASFRGLHYARQPFGELRFAAPQPLQPWDGYFNATVEGPICPQNNFLFGKLLQPRSMGEDCLRVNVHVPEHALPKPGSECAEGDCLPVLFYVSGGGFEVGSGDSDMNGPEYMIDQDVVVVTINYRLGPFGFLYLNSPSAPGNTGLRDIIAALQWLQLNARAFGGDPNRVTIMGQSAGGAAVHILTLSEATKGLFSKAILMSGTAISFYSITTQYAEVIKSAFLKNLNITSTDPEEIYRQIITIPTGTILEADDKLTRSMGIAAFSPVPESQFDGVTRILDAKPDVLIASGRGTKYPLMVGFENKVGEALRTVFEKADLITTLKQKPSSVLPLKLFYELSDEKRDIATNRMAERYFNGTPTLDGFILAASESSNIYPTIKYTQNRVATGGAPVYLFQFSYSSNFTAVKQAFNLQYEGAGHWEDLSYVLRFNAILGNTRLNKDDEAVKNWMTYLIGNFIRCSSPTCEDHSTAWPAAGQPLLYQDISGACFSVSSLTPHQQEILVFQDSLYQL